MSRKFLFVSSFSCDVCPEVWILLIVFDPRHKCLENPTDGPVATRMLCLNSGRKQWQSSLIVLTTSSCTRTQPYIGHKKAVLDHCHSLHGLMYEIYLICYLVLIFSLPFQNKSFTFTNKFIYKTLKQPWLVSFSFKSPGNWPKCSATFTKRERTNLATLWQTLKTHHVFSYLHFRINIGINQVIIFIA